LSEDLSKALNTALSRIAALEAETSQHRKREPDQAAINAAVRSAMEQMAVDPVGVAGKYSLPVDHITRVLVANAMGKDAPSELRTLAMQGPQISAQRALDAKVDELSRQFTAFLESQTKKSGAESFKALVQDKTKYPHLSKAYAEAPDLYDPDSIGANAEDFMTKEEKRLSKLHSVWNPKPASDENADKTSGQSQQTEPTQSPESIRGQIPQFDHLGRPRNGATSLQSEMKPPAQIRPDVPPIQDTKPGLFTPEDHARIRDMVVRKFEQVKA